ncbi:TetR family transcriptional regulator [Streptomyces kunmingensis]|uniref:TetR family transcriptional regulator n=1 Tax=Streptomyces kunmingensis TaxID=68225 RepID=A0ABU6C9A4_9ACTN|nr:TetR family transcriptional regulator [Streptomyces kunmingensis]MEB3961298.1 TetR family transcriptional regulator [Streptomyces kunmingensis]
MATRARRSPRRTDALTRERIIEAAVELLDTAGEGGLTFRALTERFATGPGAIYWHVANKGELLAAATEAVVAAALPTGPEAGPATASQKTPQKAPQKASQKAPEKAPENAPQEQIRTVALGLFEAIEAHPWLATQLTGQLARNARQSVTPRIFEAIGRRVQALGVPESAWFTATSALVHYILGAAGQNAANNETGRALGPDADRGQYLDAVSRTWEELDPGEYPFTRAVAAQVRDHDDREQFLAGVDLILRACL